MQRDEVSMQHVEANRAIWQVRTQAAGSNWQVCLTAWQQVGNLPLLDVLVNVVPSHHQKKSILEKQGGMAFGRCIRK